MSALLQDLRYSLRTLSRAPGFTVVAVLVIALGIGANTAMFTFANAYVLKPLPFPDAERLVLVTDIRLAEEGATRETNHGDYTDFRLHARAFESVGAGRLAAFTVTGGDAPEAVSGMQVSAGLFRTLGVMPRLGRVFTADEAAPGGPRAVVLSHSLWQARFGSRTDALGRSIELDGNHYTVVGVMPPSFRYPDRQCRLWTALQLPASERKHAVHIVARLRPETPLRAAAAELASIVSHSDNSTERGAQVALTTLYDGLNYRSEARAGLMVLLSVVAFVLLIACANVANLLLARAAARSHEIAVRMALGAGRVRIARQVLTESLVISLLGGCFGLALGVFGIRVLLAAAPARMFPLGGIEPDGNVLVFTAAASVLSGMVFGLAPALRASAAHLSDRLKQGGRSAVGQPGRGRLRQALVIAELAPAVALLIGAGLLAKSFVHLQSVDLGFRPHNVFLTELMVGESRFTEPRQRSLLVEQAIEAAARIPGVTAAGMISRIGRNTGGNIAIDGHAQAAPGREVWAARRSASADYFRAMGIPLRAGRSFDERDSATAPRVAVINETMAKRFWPGENAVGRMLRFTSGERQAWFTVIGIVGDDRQNLFGRIPPEVYVDYRQEPTSTAMLIVHSASHPAELATALRSEVRRVDPYQPLASVQSLEQGVADSAAPERITAQFLGASAAIALVLAISGLYGVIAYSMSQRRHEFGVRMALGASRGDLLRLVIGQGAVLAGIGLAVGLAIAFGVSRLLSALLFGVSSTDPLIFTAVPLTLGAAAMVACYIPARRAAALDPVAAIRTD